MNVNRWLSEPTPVHNGVKQGDIAAPTLFSIYFVVMLSLEFQDLTLRYTFALESIQPLSFQHQVSRKLFSCPRIPVCRYADLVAQRYARLIMDIFSIAFLLSI